MQPSLLPGFRTIFVEAFRDTPLRLEQLITRVNSNSASEEYGILSGIPNIRRMDGERRPKGLKATKFVIENEEWESTIRVTYKDLKFNRLASKELLVRALARKARRFPQRLALDLITTGAANEAYDGQFFFDTDHAEGASGTQSNIITDESGALNESNVARVLSALATFKDADGEVANEDVQLLLLVNPLDEVAALKVATAAINTGGGTNVLATRGIKVETDARVATNRWYGANLDADVAPIIYQEAEFIEMEALETPNRQGGEAGNQNSESFFRKTNYYGPYILANAGYGDWRTMVEVQKS